MLCCLKKKDRSHKNWRLVFLHFQIIGDKKETMEHAHQTTEGCVSLDTAEWVHRGEPGRASQPRQRDQHCRVIIARVAPVVSIFLRFYFLSWWELSTFSVMQNQENHDHISVYAVDGHAFIILFGQTFSPRWKIRTLSLIPSSFKILIFYHIHIFLVGIFAYDELKYNSRKYLYYNEVKEKKLSLQYDHPKDVHIIKTKGNYINTLIVDVFAWWNYGWYFSCWKNNISKSRF